MHLVFIFSVALIVGAVAAIIVERTKAAKAAVAKVDAVKLNLQADKQTVVNAVREIEKR